MEHTAGGELFARPRARGSPSPWRAGTSSSWSRPSSSATAASVPPQPQARELASRRVRRPQGLQLRAPIVRGPNTATPPPPPRRERLRRRFPRPHPHPPSLFPYPSLSAAAPSFPSGSRHHLRRRVVRLPQLPDLRREVKIRTEPPFPVASATRPTSVSALPPRRSSSSLPLCAEYNGLIMITKF